MRPPSVWEPDNRVWGPIQHNMSKQFDLDNLNARFADASAGDILRWVSERPEPTIATTSFGPRSAVILHLISEHLPGLPVVWVDSGYNMRDTYVVAEQLIRRLDLDMRVYVPGVTTERLNVMMGGIPTLDEPDKHAEFTRLVKLEPFERALGELEPSIWISGIRKDDTDFRRGLDHFSIDARGILKVAPVFNWSDEQLDDYLALHKLPSCRHYFDPTKVESGRECGLHTAA